MIARPSQNATCRGHGAVAGERRAPRQYSSAATSTHTTTVGEGSHGISHFKTSITPSAPDPLHQDAQDTSRWPKSCLCSGQCVCCMRSIDRGHGPLLQGRVLQERAMRAMNVIADRGQTRTYEAGLGAFDVSGLIARL